MPPLFNPSVPSSRVAYAARLMTLRQGPTPRPGPVPHLGRGPPPRTTRGPRQVMALSLSNATASFVSPPLNRAWQAPKEPPRIPHAPRRRRRQMQPPAVLGWLSSGRKSRLRQAARRTPPPRRGPRTCGPRGCVSGGACPGRAAASPPRAVARPPLRRERGRGRGWRGRRGSLAPGAAGAALPGAAGGRWAGRFGPRRRDGAGGDVGAEGRGVGPVGRFLLTAGAVRRQVAGAGPRQ